MLTEVSSVALAPKIRVNAIAPGPVEKPTHMSDQRWNALGAQLPHGKPGKSEDVAKGVLFCLENEYLTGETIFIDGGHHLL